MFFLELPFRIHFQRSTQNLLDEYQGSLYKQCYVHTYMYMSCPRQECLLKPALKRFQAEIADLSVVLMGELDLTRCPSQMIL